MKNLLLSLLMLFTCNVFAQRTVTGTVTSTADGKPLPGVNITVKGTTTGAVSNIDGKYSIKVTNDKSTLIFTFIGYETKETQVGTGAVLNIQLTENTKKLDEVVVTALGIKKDRKALGYSMSSLKSEDFTKAGTPLNALTSLYGKAAGVKVASTAGGSSAGMVINIRNSVSLNENSNTRPLIVVDGIPIFDENTSITANDRSGRDRGTGINDINASDIESMDILKGAKAAVLYGSAGANGVILITTKSGSKKKGLGIEASLSTTFETVAFLPELQNEYGVGRNVALSGQDPAMVDKDGFLYTMVDGVKTKTYFSASGNFGPKMDGSQILWWDGKMRSYSPQPDNYKDLFQHGRLSTANIVLANGSDIGSFRVSYTAKDYKGIQLGSSQQNHNLSVNANMKISDRVKVTSITNYYYTFNRNAPYQIQDMVTYGIDRDLKTDLLKDNITDQYGYWFFRNNSIRQKAGNAAGISGSYLWDQTQNINDETKHHLIQSVDLNIDLAKWLSFKVLTGFDMTRKMLEVKKKVMKPLADDPFQGYYSVGERNILNFYSQYNFNINTKITDDLSFTGLVGGAYKNNSDRSVESVTEDFLIENWFSLGNSSRTIKSQGHGTRGSDILYSVLGSAQLAYKNAFFLELQARNDWSSILPAANNSYFYPGASLSWIISQSLQMPEYINFSKVRVSWADVGRPGPRYFGNMGFNVGSYGGVGYETTNGEIPPLDFANANGKLPQENLKPERKREFEIGGEIDLFRGSRLSLDLSLFRSNTYDQIISLEIPQSSGANKIRTNAGDVQQTGWELQLKGKPIFTSDFQWSTILNISNNTTKIKKLDKGIEVLPLWGVTGAKIEARVGGQYGEIYVNPFSTNDKGERIVNADGIYDIDKNTLKKVGKLTPNVTGGFSNNFSYKGFNLGIDFDYQFGGTIISQTNMYLKGNGSGKESLKYRDEAHGGQPYYVNKSGQFIKLDSHSTAVPADSKYGFIFHDGVILPGVKADGSKNDKLISAEDYYTRTYWQGDMAVNEDVIYKSDYISLRRITLSYAIPSKFTKVIGVHNANLSVFGSNLAYLYKDLPNVSPESTLGTNSYSEQSPISTVRIFGVELKCTF